MSQGAASDEPRSMTHRLVTAAFGAFLIVLAIGILLVAEASMLVGAVIAALVVAGLGVDAFISAVRGKRSLLERVGPLP